MQKDFSKAVLPGQIRLADRRRSNYSRLGRSVRFLQIGLVERVPGSDADAASFAKKPGGKRFHDGDLNKSTMLPREFARLKGPTLCAAAPRSAEPRDIL